MAAALLALTSCVTVEQSHTVLLGERRVDFHAEHDSIKVGEYKGAFHSIHFDVERNNIEIYHMVVVYEDGERETVETRLVFDDHTRSRTITLDGWRRHIHSIEFEYRTVGDWFEGRARILVYGDR
jgi:hypothetical protein